MSIGLLPNFFFIGSPEAQAFREVRVRFLLPASYLSAAPHAEPHADGVSSGLSAAPHAVPHAAGVSSGFPAAPHAVPHADAGASSIFCSIQTDSKVTYSVPPFLSSNDFPFAVLLYCRELPEKSTH